MAKAAVTEVSNGRLGTLGEVSYSSEVSSALSVVDGRLIPEGLSGGVDHSTAPLGISLAEQIAVWKQACLESKLAIELLREFRQEVTVHEVMQYTDAVSALLEATPEECSLDQARGFTLGLQAARSVLAESASSFPVWQRIARLVDPGRTSRRIPGRFLRKVEVPEEEPLLMTRAEIRVQQALTKFLNPDADTVARLG